MERPGRTDGDALIRRLSAGERGAIDEVCRRYGPRVAAIARRNMGGRLRRRIETADLSQEAMVRIAREAPGIRFGSEAEFLRWTAAVVEHQAIAAARRWKARRRCGAEQTIGEGPESADPMSERPSVIARRNEVSEKVSEALALLGREDRRAVVARLLLGLDWAAVAASLGTTVSAAQMRLLRARRRLAEALRRSGID